MGSKCLASEGREGRLKSKVIWSGLVGTVVGGALATVQAGPWLKLTLASTASFLLLSTTFAATQETTRRLRCCDSPANSAVGGGAVGAVLFKAHGRPAFPGIVICGIIGGSSHYVLDYIGPGWTMKSVLQQLGLLDQPVVDYHDGKTHSSSITGAGNEDNASEEESKWWRLLKKYSPVREATEAEIEAHMLETAKRRNPSLAAAASDNKKGS